ncbi:hypothetical protein HLK59_31640 [Streptomyces sp. S3(2020)]|uniref:effector-associated domain EAD1-containing protein n=1 Tax=Streptomyces sp. S3(2020) TaxID=2732044 RepID=UPI001488E58D|nr:hypothetical protein [Streptomyces sp. S3(2020)]
MTSDAGKLPTEIKQALADTLANLYRTQTQAEELLDDMDFPPHTRPPWGAAGQDVVTFWRQVVRALDLGAVPREGVPQLVETALRRWPGNHDLLKIREFLRTEQRERPGAAGNADTLYRTVEFVGSEAYPEFLQLVRELVDHGALQLYANNQQAAFRVAEMPPDRLQQLQERAARIDPNVEVLYGEHDFRPTLYTRLRFRGPDQQLYEIPYVPNTTLPSELVPTIWAEYRPEVSRDANGQLRRAVVDYRDENGEARRLDPDVPLFNQGIRDGGQLEVSAESTAGVDSLLRLEAIAQAREDIADFADEHEEFTLVRMDDDRLPLRFEVELHVPGFAPPEDLEAWPLDPRPIDRHELVIGLPSEFPIQAPRVLWLSEVFHPNIARDEEFGKGSVCLGPLMTDYTPDLSLYALCQMLIDMARYRNYEILPHDYQMAMDFDSLVRDMLERGGYLDRAAAAWAFSFEGQERIKEIGGTTWLARAGLTARADRSRSLTVHRVEASPDEY